MALQELSRQPDIIGPAVIGQSLSNIGAQILSRSNEDRRRGQQLEDVASARAYADRVRGEERQGRIDDERQLLAIRRRAAMIAALQQEGLLAPGMENDEQAVADAFAEAQKRGLVKLYENLLARGLLTEENIRNPEAVEAAKRKYYEQTAGLIAQKEGMLPAQVADMTQLTQRETTLQGQLDAITGQLQQIPVDPPAGPSETEVANLAYRMAVFSDDLFFGLRLSGIR